jgi:hypothetical protein
VVLFSSNVNWQYISFLRLIGLDILGSSLKRHPNNDQDDMREEWQEMFELLVIYKHEHSGSCRVPVREGKLGRWVDRQRIAYRMNKMDDEHIALLNSIGFEWRIRKPPQIRDNTTSEESFECMLERLKRFKKEEGHCCVPQQYDKDKALGNWVKNRRSDNAKGILSEKRKAMLTEIGFEWSI